jgi:histone deacetylase 1/2
VYQLQDADPTTDGSSDSEEWASDDSSASANNWRRGAHRSSSVSRFGSQPSGSRYTPATKKRMSLVTGKYFDVPVYEGGFEHYECGTLPLKATGRRFFQSGIGKWDDELSVVDLRVEISREAYRHQDLVGLVDRVRQNDANGEDDEDEDEGAMSVDS